MWWHIFANNWLERDLLSAVFRSRRMPQASHRYGKPLSLSVRREVGL